MLASLKFLLVALVLGTQTTYSYYADTDRVKFDAARKRGDGVVAFMPQPGASAEGECERVPTGREYEQTRYTSFGQTDKTLLWKSVADYQTGTDSLARITSYAYDNRGNQTTTIYPDATTESTSFDLENRREWTQDKLGRRTTFQYDAVGRLRKTFLPDATPADLTDNPYTDVARQRGDGVVAIMPQPAASAEGEYERVPTGREYEQTVYDLTGRVTDTYDELRHRSSITYFPDGTPNGGRRKETILATGSSLLTTSYSYDAAGNVRFVTDPRGNTTETVYDAHGRPTTVIHPATDEHPATTMVIGYDLLGRRVSITDQEGKITRYRHDALGRLVEVRQYIDQSLAASDTAYSLPITANGLASTRYTYDELGNALTQTDARGHPAEKRPLPGEQTRLAGPDGAGKLPT